MRAVNLVPPESRAGRVTPGKSGGAVYGVLVGLVLIIAMLSLLALSQKSKAQAEQELASVNEATTAFQQVASRYSSYSKAAKDASDRIELVRSIADARFDWAGTLRDLARLVPRSAQIASLDASVKDGVSVGGGGSQLRAALSVPAITLKGCSVDQATVADLVTRLQAMRRVQNVTLETSETEDDATNLDKNLANAGDDPTSGSSGSDSTSDNETCSLPKPNYSFTITVFYAPGKAQTSDAVGTTPAAGGTAVAATTPATTTDAGN
ncbi:MAG: PilN domain-containing protein [Solirubrobacteraceae bacterium]|nr:PilN domain-containing protein [Solirubrobacteraceae bacterium]